MVGLGDDIHVAFDRRGLVHVFLRISKLHNTNRIIARKRVEEFPAVPQELPALGAIGIHRGSSAIGVNPQAQSAHAHRVLSEAEADGMFQQPRGADIQRNDRGVEQAPDIDATPVWEESQGLQVPRSVLTAGAAIDACVIRAPSIDRLGPKAGPPVGFRNCPTIAGTDRCIASRGESTRQVGPDIKSIDDGGTRILEGELKKRHQIAGGECDHGPRWGRSRARRRGQGWKKGYLPWH